MSVSSFLTRAIWLSLVATGRLASELSKTCSVVNSWDRR